MKKGLLSGLSAVLLAVCMIVLGVPVTARADDTCTHEWQQSDQIIQQADADHHVVRTYYECSLCGDVKKVEENVAHNWYEYDSSYCDSISDTQHKKGIQYRCSDCGEYKTEGVTENHKWEDWGSNTTYASASQHKVTTTYRCSECYKEKTESKAVNHNLRFRYGDNYKMISDAQHQFTGTYYCDKCYEDIKKTVKEGHHFDQYGTCKDCDYVRPKSVTLAPKKTVNANENTWIKIVVKKDGYICVTAKNSYGSYGNIRYSGDYKLYNKSKNLIVNAWGPEIGNSDYIAVKKGTYYIKPYRSYSIQYTFHADPSKKNYTKKKAIKAPAKKAMKGVIYSANKKKTWTRYYKIVLKKKQYVYIYNTYGTGGDLYNSKGDWIQTETDYDRNGNSKGYVTKKKLKKGTYYFKVSRDWDSARSRRQTTGFYYTFTWR